MITLRYHIATIIAIFLSLGVGILLGAVTGREWLTEQEQDLLYNLEQKYESAMESNRQLEYQVQELNRKIEYANRDLMQLVTHNYAPILEGRVVSIWYENPHEGKRVIDMLSRVGVSVHDVTDQLGIVDPPIIVVGRDEIPYQLALLSPEQKLHISQIPQSFTEQWDFLHKVWFLLKEKDGENNEQPRTG